MRGEALYRRPDPVARGEGGATGPPCRPREGRPAPLAPVGWPTGWSPEGWATGACRPLGGDRPPLFFLQGLRCKFEEKKLHLSPIALP